ncbi:MAG: DAK2 domain-containing protein [Thermoguttaceae bacterium]|nr:DAK2 domain-containing protein [Thermoguttaceae bacterium]
MSTNLTKAAFVDLLRAAQQKIKEQFDYLNRLDSATGDGDHGTAAVASLDAAVRKGEEGLAADKPLADILSDIGWSVMTETSGTTSSLVGSLFLGMAEAAPSDELSPAEVGKMFEAGLANVRGMTDAKPGDKTLMDAMVPGIEAIGALLAAGGGADCGDLFAAAADAAQKGAESTKELRARFGRAKNLGERSVGHVDAGATSMALIFRAFAEASGK